MWYEYWPHLPFDTPVCKPARTLEVLVRSHSPNRPPTVPLFDLFPSTGAYKHAGRRDSYRPYIDNDDLGDPTADFAGVICVAADEQDGQPGTATTSAGTRRGLPTPGACRWGERATSGCYSGGGSELWRTDGTAKGTRRVEDLRAGVSGSFPSYLTVFDGALFYAAHTDLTGTEMFRSDGTSGGANIVEVRVWCPSEILSLISYGDASPAQFDAVSGTTNITYASSRSHT